MRERKIIPEANLGVANIARDVFFIGDIHRSISKDSFFKLAFYGYKFPEVVIVLGLGGQKESFRKPESEGEIAVNRRQPGI